MKRRDGKLQAPNRAESAGRAVRQSPDPAIDPEIMIPATLKTQTPDRAAEVPKADDQSPVGIRAMFARIAPTYDRLNLILSGAMDRRWRRALARELTEGLDPCRRVIDIATGTGDLAWAVREKNPGAQILGVDFTRPMLELARRKYGRQGLEWAEGDGLNLPVVSGSADAACIAFGLRNMADREAGLREMRRVLRPGGRAAILEFSQPRNPVIRGVYHFYSFKVMPRIGRWLSGSDAYLYLPRSIRVFWTSDQLSAKMREMGFVRVRRLSFMGGICCLHLGETPADDGAMK